MNNEPFVSIVTPVYNGEKYIRECIESVLDQNYKNFEYIIVNNCSTDSSAEIAREYASKDARIRVHENNEFLSAVQNFNNAMRQISPMGKYCKVVHADDWIYPDCLEKMVALSEANPSVGIVGSYRLVGVKVESDGLPYQKTVFSGYEIARMNLTDGPYTFGSPSALLIRSDLIRVRDKFYSETHAAADTEACLELLQENDYGFVHQVLSFSRLHHQSITGKNRELHTDRANLFYLFKKYGLFYFSKEEYEKGMNRRIRDYYRFLGGHITRLNDRKFWKFHRAGIENVGYSFSWSRVVAGAVFLFLRNLVDTKATIKGVVSLFKGG